MSKRKVQEHIHRYERVNLGKKGFTVFRCIKPDCSHYIRKELASGKSCECNRCGRVMSLDNFSMSLVRPHCVACTDRKRKGPIEFVELQNAVIHKLG